MPNYYAHQVFGRQVLSCMAPFRDGLGSEESGEYAAFQVGLYGPDPLFFYHPMTRNSPRMLGISMHKRSVRPVAERLLQAVRDGLPYANSYAAGFLCHFALDSRCHYYIEECQARLGLSHAGMETELDRALMLADGFDPLHDTPFPALTLPSAFYETATTAAFPGVRPGQFLKGLHLFRRMCRLQTYLGGTQIYRAADWVGQHSSTLAIVGGAVLSPLPDPAYQKPTAVLMRILAQEARPTAAALTRFFRAADQKTVLDSWYDRPFSGQWRAEQKISVRAAPAR